MLSNPKKVMILSDINGGVDMRTLCSSSFHYSKIHLTADELETLSYSRTLDSPNIYHETGVKFDGVIQRILIHTQLISAESLDGAEAMPDINGADCYFVLINTYTSRSRTNKHLANIDKIFSHVINKVESPRIYLIAAVESRLPREASREQCQALASKHGVVDYIECNLRHFRSPEKSNYRESTEYVYQVMTAELFPEHLVLRHLPDEALVVDHEMAAEIDEVIRLKQSLEADKQEIDRLAQEHTETVAQYHVAKGKRDDALQELERHAKETIRTTLADPVKVREMLMSIQPTDDNKTIEKERKSRDDISLRAIGDGFSGESATSFIRCSSSYTNEFFTQKEQRKLHLLFPKKLRWKFNTGVKLDGITYPVFLMHQGYLATSSKGLSKLKEANCYCIMLSLFVSPSNAQQHLANVTAFIKHLKILSPQAKYFLIGSHTELSERDASRQRSFTRAQCQALVDEYNLHGYFECNPMDYVSSYTKNSRNTTRHIYQFIMASLFADQSEQLLLDYQIRTRLELLAEERTAICKRINHLISEEFKRNLIKDKPKIIEVLRHKEQSLVSSEADAARRQIAVIEQLTPAMLDQMGNELSDTPSLSVEQFRSLLATTQSDTPSDASDAFWQNYTKLERQKCSIESNIDKQRALLSKIQVTLEQRDRAYQTSREQTTESLCRLYSFPLDHSNVSATTQSARNAEETHRHKKKSHWGISLWGKKKSQSASDDTAQSEHKALSKHEMF